jgi:hypothetical protein
MPLANFTLRRGILVNWKKKGAIHAIGFFPAHISTIIAFMGVATPFGGTLGITIMSTVFNNTSNIARDSPFRDFSVFSQLPEDILRQVRRSAQVCVLVYVCKSPALIDGAKMGIAWAFVAIIPFMFMVKTLPTS